MENFGILSVIVPISIIVLAIITKDVVVSLLLGILLGEFIIHDYNIFDAGIFLLEDFVNLFKEAWITKSILFALLVGAVIKLIERGGGVNSFISYVQNRGGKLDSKRGSLLLAYILGVIIFIESSITALIAGTVAKPLCDKNGVSREKLALVCDSTSAPICSIILFNAWGALLLGLISNGINENIIVGDGVTILIKSILFNFYSIVTVIFVLFVVLFDIEIGSIKYSKPEKFKGFIKSSNISSPYLMLLPIFVLVLMVFLSLYYTGGGDILKGSGSTSVFYGVITTVIFIYIYYVVIEKRLKHKEYFDTLYSGISDMIPIVSILLLAFLIGDIIKSLGTASYISDFISSINVSSTLLPLIIFWISSIISFSTGTSWGTFSIMMPIALFIGSKFNIDIPLVVGAVISGGIFGDHISPISDTTIISSMASGCDHISHVRTQIPYAMVSATIASILYLIAGFILS